jgi:hypothetical protein
MQPQMALGGQGFGGANELPALGASDIKPQLYRRVTAHLLVADAHLSPFLIRK